MTQLYLDQKIKKVKKVRRSLRIRLEILLFHEIRAESFYNIKNGSSITTSKSLSKNLSNENKHTLCFKRIGILIHVLSWTQNKHQCTAVQCLFSLLRCFNEFFDVTNANLFLTLEKDSAFINPLVVTSLTDLLKSRGGMICPPAPDSAGPGINRALLKITVLEITHGIKKHTVPENGCDFRMSTYDVY